MSFIIRRTPQKWTFGSYLLFSKSRQSARKAAEILQQEDDHVQRFGTIQLDGGEAVQWVNFVRNPSRPSTRF
jgi:hypothetical protein